MSGKAETPEVVYGCSLWGDKSDTQVKFNSPETALPLLEYLRSRGFTTLDTARVYPAGAPGTSEALLGELGVGSWATVDTKVTSFSPGVHSAENIAKSISGSLAALKGSKVNVMYLHAPDRDTPFEVTLRAMDKAYREGNFAKLGISNYTADEVEELIAICEREGLVKPSVYQGRYNALCRSAEAGLLPTLRKHGISFYAYSPSAAGMFSAKFSKELSNTTGSRWDSTTMLGQHYQKDYFKEKFFQASQGLQDSAKAASISGHAVALRWIMYHSSLSAAYGDKVIIGASSLEQASQNMDIFEQGPLGEELVAKVDEVGELAKEAAPPYHM